HRLDRALTPHELIGKSRYVAHVDSGAHHRTAFGNCTQRKRYQCADRREQDGCVEGNRRQFVRATCPCRPKPEREPLPTGVAWPRESVELATFEAGDLRDDMSRCTKTIDAEAPGLTRHAQGAMPDQSRAQQGRCGRIGTGWR